MKKSLPLFFLFLSIQMLSQSVTDPAVQLTCSIQNNPAQITLNWNGNITTNSYQIFRKLKTSTSWGALLAVVSGTTNQYVDNTVAVGTNYEYRVIRLGTTYNGYGYISTGINVPETSNRGRLILIIDSTFSSALNTEIIRLIEDMEGDGWQIIRHDVNRNSSVTHVKSIIINDYNVDTLHANAIFLLGHIPVPYSGNINPDGHPDHIGAWPADCYYGDVDGIWTDFSINSTTVSPARTQNVPGDGKFDQSIIPSNLELQVGRVDFSNLPAFSSSEQQLLKNYLDKDHNYRKKVFSANKRAVISDNFGYFGGEAFAASGYKNFGPLVGVSNVTATAAGYFSTMTGNSYLWSYACGGGSYVSAGGIGNTNNFSSSNLQGVFTMMFGSYFGDWDSQNNFLRAPLAQGTILTNVWSGRPHFQFHHMALGENIGYSLIQTQNNPGNLYFSSTVGITGRWIHNALMGDPTLRNDVVSPVSNVIATRIGYNCHISWSASTETNSVGYNIYMKNDSNTIFTKINATPIAGTSYTDNCLLYKGVYKYMVRTVKLEAGPSGSYYNMSEGIADTAYNANNLASIASFTYSLLGNTVKLINTSTVSANYFWDFGNGLTSSAANPTVNYTSNGFYVIKLIANNSCYSDTSYLNIIVAEVGLLKTNYAQSINLNPNPNYGKITIQSSLSGIGSCSIYDKLGKQILYFEKTPINSEIDLSK